MRILVCALAALSLAACATAPVPNARPLTAEHIATMGPTPVAVGENNLGVTKSWFYQSSAQAGAQFGLIGALVSATLDAIVNYGPSKRATQAADEIAEIMPTEALDASLAAEFRRAAAETPGATGVVIADVSTVQKITAPDAINDAAEVQAFYRLSEDASTLQIGVTVTYHNTALPYVSPYTFEGSPPKTELEGPTYRNTFTYTSNQLPLPVLTPELKERLIVSIQDSARDETGALPVEGTDAFKSMTRELEQARDDELSKAEIAIFLTREWIKDNGALLRAEVENGHAFIARYVVLDMNRTAIPSLEGQDEVVETLADGRTVRRMGSGTLAGSYTSSPGDVAGFATYGNVAAAARAHTDRMTALRETARAEERARRAAR
ncbi:MAG: hypothetical protein REJ23_00825 [Brevundimonas sp.]|nr:hypothetical protein [Brevundimonas sp.]